MAYLHNKHHNSKLAILMCPGNNTFIADYFKKMEEKRKVCFSSIIMCTGFLTVCIVKITFQLCDHTLRQNSDGMNWLAELCMIIQRSINRLHHLNLPILCICPHVLCHACESNCSVYKNYNSHLIQLSQSNNSKGSTEDAWERSTREQWVSSICLIQNPLHSNHTARQVVAA